MACGTIRPRERRKRRRRNPPEDDKAANDSIPIARLKAQDTDETITPESFNVEPEERR